MEEMALVSIVIPIYKVEKYIAQCVDSVIAQSYRKLEIILVDDGSPDKCGEICDSYAIKDDRIRVIHQKNSGLSAARNAGIKAATGEYITFLDSDDYYASEHAIEKMTELIRTQRVDLAIFAYCDVDSEGREIQKHVLPEGNIPFTEGCTLVKEEEFWRLKTASKEAGYALAWNRIYPRRLFAHTGFPEGLYFEDEYILHEIISQCECIAFSDYPVICYRQHEQSITHLSVNPYELDRADGMLHRFDYFYDRGMYDLLTPLWLFGSLCLIRAKKNHADKSKIRIMYRRYCDAAKKILAKCSISRKQKYQLVLFIFNLNGYIFVRNFASDYKI